MKLLITLIIKIISKVKWYVYIIECSDNTLYTGATNNVIKRINKHNKGKGAKYTRGRYPVTLMWSYELDDKSKAYKLEYKLKKLSRNDKICVINGELTPF